jgi:hypothetical protein
VVVYNSIAQKGFAKACFSCVKSTNKGVSREGGVDERKKQISRVAEYYDRKKSEPGNSYDNHAVQYFVHDAICFDYLETCTDIRFG